jgi:uncharacterized membrane protein
VPDLSIATVMGQAARATPVQVYVGLDSAPDGRTRVELAMAELDRTGGWGRSLRMLISPAGNGYVNYCAVAAAEYLTLGDLATVTWLDPGRPPVRHVPGASPRGVPPTMHWRPLTTFLQTFVDMKCATFGGVPGVRTRLPTRPRAVRQRGLRPSGHE